jgi:HEAT repeat protein
MLSKSEISLLKNSNNEEIRDLIYKNIRNNSFILNILKNLGKLSDGFDGERLLQLLESRNNNIRLLAVKNIGKLRDDRYIDDLKIIARNDNDTSVRREAVSSIGRMRNEKTKNILLDFLNDEDPKIVCQAIRGLLVFKGDKEIDKNLKSLSHHINETVRSIIEKEYFPKSDKISKQAHNECYE